MRTVIYGAACSLDGFIAAANGGMDWLHFSPDAQKAIGDLWSRIDTILMGRKTWEAGAASGRPQGGPPGTTTYLFSRTLRTSPHPEVRLVSEDAGAFVHALKRRDGKDVFVMGGGELARSLFAAGAIDEVGLNIHPVLLGSGVPLFRDAGRVMLDLVESRTIAGGCVLATYRVKPGSP